MKLNADHLFGGPTDLPTHCPTCGAFLKRSWVCEDDPEDRVTLYSVECSVRTCRMTVVVRR